MSSADFGPLFLALAERKKLKEQRPAFVRKSATSESAAEGMRGSAATLRAKVLALLRSQPNGLTDEEMQQALGMNPSTQRPRRIELVTAGFVIDSGATRKTRSGRNAVVWVTRG